MAISDRDVVAGWYGSLDVQAWLADEVSWELAEGFPEAGLYRTRAEVIAVFERLLPRFSRWQLRVDEIAPAGEGRVVSTGAYLGRWSEGGPDFAAPFCHLWKVRAGRIVAVRQFPNVAPMQAAWQAACAGKAGHGSVGKEAGNLTVVRRCFELFVNARRDDLIAEFFDPGIELPDLGLKGYYGLRAWTDGFRAPFPDIHDEIVAIAASADRVMTWVRVTATHLGPWRGVPPTGKQVAWNGVAIDTLRAGRIAVRRVVIDFSPVEAALGLASRREG
jgi:ketosteroid isomerase-like protein/predicted ester cyclase